MGARKRLKAEQSKEEQKKVASAILRNCPTSPRKMRLVADLIREVEVNKALNILKYNSKEASRRLEKLLLSAIANWQQKNEGVRIEESNLFVKEIFVDSGRMLKRLRPAPQGRGYRIRKRSNHVTLVLDSKINESKTE
jgi:large subunit ribosomal protein L22